MNRITASALIAVLCILMFQSEARSEGLDLSVSAGVIVDSKDYNLANEVGFIRGDVTKHFNSCLGVQGTDSSIGGGYFHLSDPGLREGDGGFNEFHAKVGCSIQLIGKLHGMAEYLKFTGDGEFYQYGLQWRQNPNVNVNLGFAKADLEDYDILEAEGLTISIEAVF